MPDSTTYRNKRKEDSANRFLSGEARSAYVLRQDISAGLKEQVGKPSTNPKIKVFILLNVSVQKH